MKNFNNTTKRVKKSVQNPLNRDAMDQKLFFKFFNSLPRNTFVEKRLVLCVMLLFITGCRINELRNFDKKIIMDLLNRGTVMISTYKSRMTRRVDIDKSRQKLLRNNLDLIEDFFKVLGPNNHVLTSEQGKEINTRSVFNWLNKELKEFGDKNGKILMSHSFRIGYVTDIMKHYPVDFAQSIIGHKDTNTTMRYEKKALMRCDGSILSSEQVKSLLEELDKEE